MGVVAELVRGITIRREDKNSCYISVPIEGVDNVALARKWLDYYEATGAIQDPEHLHITLCVIEDLSDDQIPYLLSKISMPIKFVAEAVQLATFVDAPSRPLVLLINPDPALLRLQSEIYNAALRMDLSFPKGDHFKANAYHPHITLALDVHGLPEDFESLDEPIKFGVDRFTFGRDGYQNVITAHLPGSMGDRVLVTVKRSYPAPHCGRPGEIGGSTPRDECADVAVKEKITKDDPKLAQKAFDWMIEGNNREEASITDGGEMFLAPDGRLVKVDWHAKEIALFLEANDALEEFGIREHEMLKLEKGEASAAMMDATEDLIDAGLVRIKVMGGRSHTTVDAAPPLTRRQKATIADIIALIPKRGKFQWEYKKVMEPRASKDNAGFSITDFLRATGIEERSFVQITEAQFKSMLRGERVVHGPLRKMITLEDGPFNVKGAWHGGVEHDDQEGRKGQRGGSQPGYDHDAASVGEVHGEQAAKKYDKDEGKGKTRFRYNSSMTSEARVMPNGDVQVGPKWFDLDDRGKAGVLAHEAGHMIFDEATEGDPTEYWRLNDEIFQATDEEKESGFEFAFGTNNTQEAASEAYSVFVDNPEELKERYPEAYDWMEEQLAKPEMAQFLPDNIDYGEISKALGEKPELNGISTLYEHEWSAGEEGADSLARKYREGIYDSGRLPDNTVVKVAYGRDKDTIVKTESFGGAGELLISDDYFLADSDEERISVVATALGKRFYDKASSEDFIELMDSLPSEEGSPAQRGGELYAQFVVDPEGFKQENPEAYELINRHVEGTEYDPANINYDEIIQNIPQDNKNIFSGAVLIDARGRVNDYLWNEQAEIQHGQEDFGRLDYGGYKPDVEITPPANAQEAMSRAESLGLFVSTDPKANAEHWVSILDDFDRFDSEETRQLALKTWEKRFKDFPPEEEFLRNVYEGAEIAIEKYGMPVVPFLSVRAPDPDFDPSLAGGNFVGDQGTGNSMINIFDSGGSDRDKKWHEVSYETFIKDPDLDRFVVDEIMPNTYAGTYIHEVGHWYDKLHQDRPRNRASKILFEHGLESVVKDKISSYATTNGAELVAEAFVMKTSGLLDEFDDETKKIVNYVLFGGEF